MPAIAFASRDEGARLVHFLARNSSHINGLVQAIDRLMEVEAPTIQQSSRVAGSVTIMRIAIRTIRREQLQNELLQPLLEGFFAVAHRAT